MENIVIIFSKLEYMLSKSHFSHSQCLRARRLWDGFVYAHGTVTESCDAGAAVDRVPLDATIPQNTKLRGCKLQTKLLYR